MAKPPTDNREYVQVTKGLVDQRSQYRLATTGRTPLLAGVTFTYFAGTAQFRVAPGNRTGTFNAKRKVALVRKGAEPVLAVVSSSAFDAGNNWTNVFVAAPVLMPAALDDVAVFVTFANSGWEILAQGLDSDIATLLSLVGADEATGADLAVRIGATISDQGADSVVAKPGPELIPYRGTDPRALNPSGTVTKQSDYVFRVEDNINAFGQAQPGDTFGRYIVMVRAGGERVPTFVKTATGMEVGPDELVDVEIVADGPVVPADIVNVEMALFAISVPKLTLDQIPDQLLTADKFFPALAHRSTYDADLAEVKEDLGAIKARAADTEAQLAVHAGNRTVHGVSGDVLMGATEMNAMVATHDADPFAHLGPGGAFTGIQRTVDRGRAGGYVPLDSAAQVTAQYLPGPYGVKRVITALVALTTTLVVDTQFPSLVAAPLNLAKSVLFADAQTTIASTENETFYTAELRNDGTGVIVKHGDETSGFAIGVTVSVTIVEFY